MTSIHPKRLLKELEAEFDLELKREMLTPAWRMHASNPLPHDILETLCLPTNPKTP